ncbi:hypothetical protein MMC30_001300 [Trapelia coarctata]|nr:hypothetical protein [Trapelia coarctata]
MASRQLGEHLTVTRQPPVSPAQHSGKQGTDDNGSEKGPSPILNYSSNRPRAVSSIGGGPEKTISSAANFPTTNLAPTSRAASVRSRSSNPPTHKLSPSPYASPAESYFTTRPTSSGIEARPPAQKRPPASRSSHGIETSTGPPPALSTQRTKSTESIWKTPPAEEFRQAYPSFSPKASFTTDAVPSLGRGGQKGDAPVERATVAEISTSGSERVGSEDGQGPANLKEQTIVATKTRLHKEDSSGESGQTQKPYSKDIDLEKMSAQLDKVMRRNTTTEEIRSQPSQEDLFLNLAHTDNVPDGVTGRDERRRSRIAQTTHRPSVSQGTVQATDRRPQSSGASYERAQHSLIVMERRSSVQRAEEQSFLRTPISSGRPVHNHRSYAASAHPLDSRHQTRLSGAASRQPINSSHNASNHEASPDLPRYGRRSSITETTLGFQPKPYRQSRLSHAANGQYHSSPLNSRSQMYEQGSPPTPRAEGTESTVSTTAPSTIFDELDDLKSRLRKLELTAKMPTSSGAAITSAANERPPTATTTVTTLSSSPKRGRHISTSPEESVLNGQVDSSVHPLLHQALAKSKLLVRLPVYRALETAVSDALAMVQMTTINLNTGTASNGIDRKVKRKADGVCRSLTELCIALSEEKPKVDSEQPKLGSPLKEAVPTRMQREDSAEPQRTRRAMSHDPEESTASRVLSRLEARRTSMLVFNGNPQGNSAARESPVDVATPAQAAASMPTLNRTSTVLQRARRVIDDDNDRTVRPFSRTNTDLSLARPPVRHTTGTKDYIQTAANQDQRSPTLQSALPVRRHFLNSNLHSPTTPPTQLSTPRYHERTTPNSADSLRLVEARQRRLASMGQYNLAVRQGSDSLGRQFRRPSVDQVGVDRQGVD